VERCSYDGCKNQSQKGGLCKKHEADVKHYLCSIEGCQSHVVQGGVCRKHRAEVTYNPKLCSEEGYTNQAENRGVCIKHLASWKEKKCGVDVCFHVAQTSGVCKGKEHGHGPSKNVKSAEAA